MFDVLSLDGRDLTWQPYAARRELLTDLAADSYGRTVQFPGAWTNTDPTAVLAAAKELNLEGIVCKHLDSPYKPGLRSPDWIKTPLRRRSEVIIGGWVAAPCPNRPSVGALLLGAHRPDGLLRFCGIVGTGFSQRHRRSLAEQLRPLACTQSPFAGDVPTDVACWARWATPALIGDVEYREYERAFELGWVRNLGTGIKMAAPGVRKPPL